MANAMMELDKVAKSDLTFLQTIAKKHCGLPDVLKFYSPKQKAALNESSGVTGGYLIPEEYTLELFKSIAEKNFLWPRTTRVPMRKSSQMSCPLIDATTAQSAGTSAMFGGLTFSWGPSEGVNLATSHETEPTFRGQTLVARDLTGLAVVSNQFIDDIGEEGQKALLAIFALAAGWYAEYAFFNGLGADAQQPIGILNAQGKKTQTRAVASQIGVADVTGMAAKMLPMSWSRSLWACSPTALQQVTSLTDFVVNQNTQSLEEGCAGSLLSRPLFVTEKLPALGSTGDLIFIDPKMYVVGERKEVIIEASQSPYFRTNQTAYRIWLRLDGKPLLDNIVTLADGSSTTSPFVILV